MKAPSHNIASQMYLAAMIRQKHIASYAAGNPELTTEAVDRIRSKNRAWWEDWKWLETQGFARERNPANNGSGFRVAIGPLVAVDHYSQGAMRNWRLAWPAKEYPTEIVLALCRAHEEAWDKECEALEESWRNEDASA